jgi:Lon protease-like protein
LIREGEEVGAPAVPERIGTLAKIEDWDMPQLGVLQVRVTGQSRFKIVQHNVKASGLIAATVQHIADDPHRESDSLAVCRAFLKQILSVDATDASSNFDDAFWVSMRLTERLPLGYEIKQKMLELTDATIRLELVQRFLSDHGLVQRA